MSTLQIDLRNAEHVVREAEGGLSIDKVVLKSGRVYLPATVLGKFLTGPDAGKHTILNPLATDGSQTADAVLFRGVRALDGDRTAVAHARKCTLNFSMLCWPDGITDTAKNDAIAALKAKNIQSSTSTGSVGKALPGGPLAPVIFIDAVNNLCTVNGVPTTLEALIKTSQSATTYTGDASGTPLAISPGVLRRTNRGLRGEAAKTNLLRYSTDPTNAAWSVANGATKGASLGTFGPFQRVPCTATTASTQSGLNVTSLTDLTADQDYAVTFWYEKGTSGNVMFRVQQNFGGTQPVNIGGKIGETTIGATSSLAGTISEIESKNLTGNIWRTTFKFTPSATGPHIFRIGPYSLTNGEDIVVLGAQVEADFHTSIIPTTSATVTRPADDLTWIGALAAALDSPTGSMVLELDGVPNGYGDILSCGPSDAVKLISAFGNDEVTSLVNGKTVRPKASASVLSETTTHYYEWSRSGRGMAWNNGLAGFDTTVLPFRSPMRFFASLAGYIRKLSVYDRPVGVPLAAKVPGWKPMKSAGGGGGFFTRVHRSTRGTLFTRIDVYGGGRRRTTDTEWNEIITAKSMPNPNLNLGQGITEIVTAPSNPDVVYMIYGDGYTYRSADEGEHFVRTNIPQLVNMGANRTERLGGPFLAVDPNDENTFFVTSPTAVYKSGDGGQSSTTVAGLGTANSTGFAVAFDPSGPVSGDKTQVVYFAKGGTGVYRSADAGATVALEASSPNSFRDMVVDWVDGTVYVAPNAAGTSNLAKRVSGTWSTVAVSTGTSRPPVGVAIDPTDRNRIVCLSALGFISVSTDKAVTFPAGMSTTVLRAATKIPWHAWTNEQLFATANMIFDSDGYLVIGEGIGVWRTKPGVPNAGVTVWEEYTDGLDNMVCGHIYAPGGGAVYTGVWDRKLFRTTDPDRHIRRHGLNNVSSISHGMHIDGPANDPDFIACLSNAGYSSGQPATAEDSGYSEDGGRRWKPFANKPSDILTYSKFGGRLAVSDRQKMMWGCSEYGRLFYSADRGDTAWTVATATGLKQDIALLTGSISSNTLTVTAASGSPIVVGMVISGAPGSNVPAALFVTGFGTGSGGTGTYTLSASASVGSTSLAAISNTGLSPSKNNKRDFMFADELVNNRFFVYCEGGHSTPGIYQFDGAQGVRICDGNIVAGGQYDLKFRQKPGTSNEMFFTNGRAGLNGTLYVPHTPSAFMRSRAGGVTGSWMPVPDVQEVWDFSWGKAAPWSPHPTLYILGYYKGIFGHWRSEDDCQSFMAHGPVGADYFPSGSLDTECIIAADPDIYGRLYAGFQGSSFKYFDLAA